MTGYWVFPKRRRALLLSGLLSMPSSLTTFYFVPEYWQPVRLFDFPLGIEDIFFSFSTGMMVWFLMEVRYGNAISETGWSRVLPRYFKVLALGIAMIFFMRQIPIMVMNQALIGIIITGGDSFLGPMAGIADSHAFWNCILYILYAVPGDEFCHFPGFFHSMDPFKPFWTFHLGHSC